MKPDETPWGDMIERGMWSPPPGSRQRFSTDFWIVHDRRINAAERQHRRARLAERAIIVAALAAFALIFGHAGFRQLLAGWLG